MPEKQLKSLKTLEFDKILERLSSYTESADVKKRIAEIVPYTEIDEARTAQKETTEAMSTLLKLGSPPVNLSVESSILGAVKRSERDGVLHAKELINVSRLLYIARRMKSYLGEAAEECNVLHGIAENIITAKQLEDKINSCIVSENEIADDASSELNTIRRKIRNLNAKIKESLDSMVRSNYYRKFLQDPIVTMRSDRYVIPVRSEYRSEVNGIVHDTSASGATLFIEPMSVVNSNNEIRDLMSKEQREIERILAELSALVAENSHTIFVDFKNVTELDFIFCKGRLSLDMDANEPVLNDKGIIRYKKARHPLIDKDKVVANDIMLGGDYDTIVVTGPNTGGKTVTLKTIGLFSLMAAAGLHIPAQDNSEAAVFNSIFADIGDEQSIEQSLSTFSSHMVNIVKILESVSYNSLVLFDELGAGTDPTEGAALAISILEFLRAKKVTTVATTHYSELKLFALSTDGVENASCEFDVATLQPTYKLLIGVPGKSNAFAISRRLGLDERVIDRANDILSDEDIKFEDVITDLEQNRARARKEADEATKMKNELKDLRRQLENDRIKLKENKSRILDDARREAKILVMDAKEEANSIIRDLEKMRQNGMTAGFDKKTAAMRDKLSKKEDTIDKAMARAAKPKKTYVEPPKDLKPGAAVKIVDMNQEATVLKEPDKNGNVRVQAGIIKMDVHVTNLRKIEEKTSKELADKYTRTARTFESKAKTVSTEVDVRGQNLEEAWMNVEKFLDDCYLAGISPVSIIHGKGTGILRKGIQGYLKKHRYVTGYRNGRFGEGEDGVTIVELK
ncbi:MAG: endonuclease MutS2 [Oscillospiraceae bacterium]|nr:endonuclease MutS2 [Oscillospiraceae bacterium]